MVLRDRILAPYCTPAAGNSVLPSGGKVPSVRACIIGANRYLSGTYRAHGAPDRERGQICAFFRPICMFNERDFFCLYVDDGRFSFSRNQIPCEGAPGATGNTPVGPTTRPDAGKKKFIESNMSKFIEIF